MNILFTIGTLFPSQAGGPSNTIYWLAKALVQKGVKTTIVTTETGAENKIVANKWLHTNYGEVIYYSVKNSVLPLKLIWQSISLIRRNDCVHLNSLFYPPSVIVATVALIYKKPVLWSVRGNLEFAALQYSKWKKKPILWFIRTFLNSSRVTFHATSESEFSQIKKVIPGNSKVVNIPNFIALPQVCETGFTKDKYFLYVGRIHPIKALDRLIEALSLSNVFLSSDYLLKIAGEGDENYVNTLKRLVSARNLDHKVSFLGHIEGERKEQLYADAFFSILPSHSENFGNVVIESMAQGTPVITSIYTPWEVLPQNSAGVWTDNTIESLTNCINDVLTLSEKEYETVRTNAYHLIKEKFDIDKNISIWLTSYSMLIENK